MQVERLSPTCMLKGTEHSHEQFVCKTLGAYHVQRVVCHVVWRWRGGSWSTWRKPLTMSFRKCHILKPEKSSPNQDSNPHSSIGGRRFLGKQTCWTRNHVSIPASSCKHGLQGLLKRLLFLLFVLVPTGTRSLDFDSLLLIRIYQISNPSPVMAEQQLTDF